MVRYARVCSDVSNFNERNRCITEKLLHQGYRYHKLLKSFTKFFHRYKEIIQKFGCSRRSLIKNGISHPKFYGNIVYLAHKFKNCPSKLTVPLNKLLQKGYDYHVVVHSLNLVFLGKNIDTLVKSLIRG